MTSQWPLIMTAQWVMTLLGMHILKSQWVMTFAKDIHCNVTISNDVAMCTYHGVTIHNDYKPFLLCIFCSMPNYDFIMGSMQ